MDADWTADRKGRSNASKDYLSVLDDVAGIVANARVGDDPKSVARTIVSHLAHRRGMGPPTRNDLEVPK